MAVSGREENCPQEIRQLKLAVHSGPSPPPTELRSIFDAIGSSASGRGGDVIIRGHGASLGPLLRLQLGEQLLAPLVFDVAGATAFRANLFTAGQAAGDPACRFADGAIVQRIYDVSVSGHALEYRQKTRRPRWVDLGRFVCIREAIVYISAVSTRLSFIRPQSPSASVRPPKGDDWMYEPKWDGFRFQVIKDGAGVRFYSRHGAEYTDRCLAWSRPSPSCPRNRPSSTANWS